MTPQTNRELVKLIERDIKEMQKDEFSPINEYDIIERHIDAYCASREAEASLKQAYKMRSVFHNTPENKRLWDYCKWMDNEVRLCEIVTEHLAQLGPK